MNRPSTAGASARPFLAGAGAGLILVVAMLTPALAQTPAPQAPPQPFAPSWAMLAGWDVFAGKSCGKCHAVRGTLATGTVAPDLTHFAGRPTISTGVLTNTPENLARYLHDPNAVKPGVLMPNFRLSDDDIQALVAYLEGLR